ncbi:DNA-binding transcriptional regulator, MarR family [Devosia sp. YR412]|uniref:MarR family winged helix-turn-helix transcriptional regulator n=1 Tax=Devosia sp. YR412 TaxID=1881030 RepID=UPI0008C4D8AD|nr:MarR family transcriptional regulator [Devosia sp. YR412]SEQ52810.1 DNA-binding transcriptional regulator, MarR family [Devosia sp. YR412]
MQPSDPPIGYLIHEVSKAFRRRFEEVARQHDLTLPQWRVLAELTRQGGLSQTRLAGAVDADPMTMSGILDRLDKRGLVDRQQDPADSRAKIVRLTPEGEALFKTAKALGTELSMSAVDGMSAAELTALADGLTRIRNNLSGMAAEQKDSV